MMNVDRVNISLRIILKYAKDECKRDKHEKNSESRLSQLMFGSTCRVFKQFGFFAFDPVCALHLPNIRCARHHPAEENTDDISISGSFEEKKNRRKKKMSS